MWLLFTLPYVCRLLYHRLSVCLSIHHPSAPPRAPLLLPPPGPTADRGAGLTQVLSAGRAGPSIAYISLKDVISEARGTGVREDGRGCFIYPLSRSVRKSRTAVGAQEGSVPAQRISGSLLYGEGRGEKWTPGTRGQSPCGPSGRTCGAKSCSAGSFPPEDPARRRRRARGFLPPGRGKSGAQARSLVRPDTWASAGQLSGGAAGKPGRASLLPRTAPRSSSAVCRGAAVDRTEAVLSPAGSG